MIKARSQVMALLALAGLAVIWGYNWVVMKIAMRDAPPFDFAAMRTFFGAISLFLVMLALRRPLRPKAIPETMLFGLLQVTGVTGLIAWALVSGGAGKTAVLNYTMPFWSLLFAWFFLGESLKKTQWVSVGLALLGLIGILLPFNLSSDWISKGLAVLAGVSWALSSILAKRMGERQQGDLLSFTAWQMLFGSIPLIVIAILLPSPPVHWTPSYTVALIYNVIPGSAIAWLLWLYALNHLSTAAAGLGMLAVPVVGVLAAWIQLGEQPSVTEAIGGLLIVAALLLNTLQALQSRLVSVAERQSDG